MDAMRTRPPSGSASMTSSGVAAPDPAKNSSARESLDERRVLRVALHEGAAVR
jgi:hypothetical protein